MQVTAEQTNPCTIVLDIEVDEQQVSRAFDSTYKEFGRYTNVPGFRPGKAPRAIVERYVNKEKVREQTLEKIIRDSYFKAIEEESITPYRNPDIEPADLEDKKTFAYKAIVPLEPQITLGEYTGLTLEKPLFTITDDMVEERVNALREERSRLERVTDRGVEQGDVLIAEKRVVLEGEAEPDTPPRRQLLQFGENEPGVDEALIGMMPDEERTIDVTFPDDYAEEAKRGKKATATVKLASISAKKLPELNDEFAKQIAGFETVDELRNGVRERLETEAAQLSDQVAEQRLFTEILNRSTIYFPEVLIREEVEDDLRRLAQELRQRNIPYGQFLAMQNLTAEQHQNGLAAQAEQQIRTLLALRQISILEDLQATNEEVDAEFERLLAENTITEEQLEEFKADGRRRLQVANALIQQRLHDFLFANNTLNEVEQEAPADPDALLEEEAAASANALSASTAESGSASEASDADAATAGAAGSEDTSTEASTTPEITGTGSDVAEEAASATETPAADSGEVQAEQDDNARTSE